MHELNESHAALDHAARQQAVGAELLGRFLFGSIDFKGLQAILWTGRAAPAPAVCMRNASSYEAIRAAISRIARLQRDCISIQVARFVQALSVAASW